MTKDEFLSGVEFGHEGQGPFFWRHSAHHGYIVSNEGFHCSVNAIHDTSVVLMTHVPLFGQITSTVAFADLHRWSK